MIWKVPPAVGPLLTPQSEKIQFTWLQRKIERARGPEEIRQLLQHYLNISNVAKATERANRIIGRYAKDRPELAAEAGEWLGSR